MKYSVQLTRPQIRVVINSLEALLKQQETLYRIIDPIPAVKHQAESAMEPIRLLILEMKLADGAAARSEGGL